VFSALSVLNGQELTVRFDQANGASPTLNVDSLGAKSIKIDATTAVPTGLIAADSIWRVTYDNSIPAFILNGVPAALSLGSITTSGDVTVGGDAAVTGDVTAANVTTTDDATIGGDAAVTGDVSGATATISGNATVGGTATITGALTANNSAGVTARNTSKAFAKFTQSGTTVSFTASTDGHNIASITRTGAGTYTVAFTAALPTVNYAVIGAGFNSSDQLCVADAQSRTTTGFTMTTRGTSNLTSASDVVRCDFAVFGY
jgi:cytoskeletal protein CcmA (bactofilin family)